MTHREAIKALDKIGGYSQIVINRWLAVGRIPLIFIPDVAHRVGCKPSDLSSFYKKPMIMIGE